jgi:YHS domain-containing protein
MKIIIIPLAVIAIASVSCNKQEGNNAAASAVEAGSKPYPLETCLVSGEKLGSMGEPVVINHEGQEIKFCCDACVPKFEKDPAKYLSDLEHAGHKD